MSLEEKNEDTKEENKSEDKQNVQVLSVEEQWQESRDKHQELIKPVVSFTEHYKQLVTEGSIYEDSEYSTLN
jgi:hypothetical protein